MSRTHSSPALVAALGLLLALAACDDSKTVAVDANATPGPGDLGPIGSDASPRDTTADLLPARDAPPVADAKPTPTDTAPPPDGGPVLGKALEGLWLVGWIGGLNRFSWIRFEVTATDGGKAMIAAGKLGGGTVPYWNCSGAASWNYTAKPDTIQLHYPSADCTPGGMKSGAFTFKSIAPFTEAYPAGAQQVAEIEALAGGSPQIISGYKFPDDQCDAAMTSCKDPL